MSIGNRDLILSIGLIMVFFFPYCYAVEVSTLDLLPQQIKADSVSLNIIVNLDNKESEDSKNVSLVIKAFDPNTEYLINKSNPISVGSIEKGKSKNVTLPFTLPRRGSCNILAVLYENQSEVQKYWWNGRNLEIPYVEIIKPEFKIRNIEDFNILLQPTIYVRNTANKKSPNFNVTVKAKIKDTDQVIDTDTNKTKEINPLAVSIMSFRLTIPEKYKNFDLDIAIWEKDICIKNDKYKVEWGSDDSGDIKINYELIETLATIIPIVSKL